MKKDFCICDFGASVDATPRENASAIQRAIDAAGDCGGRVVVPEGTFVSGTIWLKSNMMLHLEKGAVLKASPDLEDYNSEDAYPENFGCPKDEYWRGLHFIICHRQQYTGIDGEGTIDGNGDAFFDPEPLPYFDWMKSDADCWWNGIRWAKDKEKLRPGQLVVFVKTTGVTIDGITIRNSPCWSLFFHGCENIEILNYTVRNGMNDGNTDGVDIDCTKYVRMENLDIDTGDDAIAIRASGRRLGLDPQPSCENIRISNARLNSTSSVFRIGVGEGEIKDVVVENVTSDRGGAAINMSTLYGDADRFGVDMCDITFRNCTFNNCRIGYALVTRGKKLEYGIRDVLFDAVRWIGPDGKPQTKNYRIDEAKPIENFKVIDPDLKLAVAEDMKVPVRPGGVGGQPFWNRCAEWFMYPPAFDFASVPDAVKYRFEFILDGHQRLHWDSAAPTDCLSPIWNEIPENGFVTVFCHGLDESGRVIGFSGEATFWKTVRFQPNVISDVRSSPGEAAAKVYEYLFNMPSARYFLETGKPDPSYRLNCYPAKIHSSTVRAMLRYAKLRPEHRDEALRLARTAADYLISISQPAGSPLEFMPPTYQGGELAAASYGGEQMMLYPAFAGRAYLALHAETKDAAYLDAARRIGETYLKLQGDDGTCWLKIRESDGSNVSENRAFPIGIAEFLEDLFAEIGDRRYREAADRGFEYVDRGPLTDWNWEGQFEDVKPTEKYVNLTKHPACEAAQYILRRFPGDNARIAQAREILRWSEDQFVVWKTPCRADGTGYRSTGKRPGHFNGGRWDSIYSNWLCPAVTEQYYCYVPIDSSAAKVINTFLALYRIEKNPLYLAKARALADSAIRIQSSDGRIPTFWSAGSNAAGDWINCMAAMAFALENLESVLKG